ncbi:MAG: MalY/PatB family protein [Rhodoluna sp.]
MATLPTELRPLEELRERHSSKWRRFNRDVLPMHVAEMDYEIAPSIKSLIIEMTTRSDLGYLGPIPELGEAFAGFAKRHWNWAVEPSEVRLATDVGVGSVEIMRAVGKPGDKVVVNSPVYHSFYTWIEEVGMTVVDAPLIREKVGGPTEENPDTFEKPVTLWRLDLAAIEKAFKDGAKIFLMCNPQNPVGRMHTRDELRDLASLAAKYDVLVISDEIHAPLAYPGETFTPYLSVSDEAKQTGVTVTAASKSFNLAGLKASILVIQSDEVRTKLARLPEAMHWRSSLIGAFAMADAFENGDGWLKGTMMTLTDSRKLIAAEIAEKLPTVDFHLPENGYLAWLDLSSLNLGHEPAALLLAKEKVAFVPGDEHGAAYGQFVRINFACRPASIRAAIDKIANQAAKAARK